MSGEGAGRPSTSSSFGDRLAAARRLCARVGHLYMPITGLADGRVLSVCRCCGLHAALPAGEGDQ